MWPPRSLLTPHKKIHELSVQLAECEVGYVGPFTDARVESGKAFNLKRQDVEHKISALRKHKLDSLEWAMSAMEEIEVDPALAYRFWHLRELKENFTGFTTIMPKKATEEEEEKKKDEEERKGEEVASKKRKRSAELQQQRVKIRRRHNSSDEDESEPEDLEFDEDDIRIEYKIASA